MILVKAKEAVATSLFGTRRKASSWLKFAHRKCHILTTFRDLAIKPVLG